jgi:peptidoglycan/xylan/chitin deacetylase (PgdA/CDA1 family)
MVTADALLRITGRRPDGVRVEAGWVPQSERRARRRRPMSKAVARRLEPLPPPIISIRVLSPDQKMLKARNE